MLGETIVVSVTTTGGKQSAPMTTTNQIVLSKAGSFATQASSFTKAMSGSEKRREEVWSSCALEVSEVVGEGGKRSSVPAVM